MNQTIQLLSSVGSSFASNKDIANQLRQDLIMPAIKNGEIVVIDFSGVEAGTQSFVHALIAEPIQVFGEKALIQMQFKSCSPIIKNLIGLVIDYTRIAQAF